MTDSVLQRAVEAQYDRLFDSLSKILDGVDDHVLPDQFFESSQAPVPPGEKKIRFRVLRDSLREFRKTAFATSKAGRKRHDETYKWIITNDFAWPYSFVNLCEVFGLNVEAARGALIRWKVSEKVRRYETEASSAVLEEGHLPTPSAGHECCPGFPPEGWSDEAPEHAEGRRAEQAA